MSMTVSLHLCSENRSTEKPTVGATSSSRSFVGFMRFTSVVFPPFARPTTKMLLCEVVKCGERVGTTRCRSGDGSARRVEL
eukprot:30980-Pelagococcus_subviridis.AAC.45